MNAMSSDLSTSAEDSDGKLDPEISRTAIEAEDQTETEEPTEARLTLIRNQPDCAASSEYGNEANRGNNNLMASQTDSDKAVCPNVQTDDELGHLFPATALYEDSERKHDYEIDYRERQEGDGTLEIQRKKSEYFHAIGCNLSKDTLDDSTHTVVSWSVFNRYLTENEQLKKDINLLTKAFNDLKLDRDSWKEYSERLKKDFERQYEKLEEKIQQKSIQSEMRQEFLMPLSLRFFLTKVAKFVLTKYTIFIKRKNIRSNLIKPTIGPILIARKDPTLYSCIHSPSCSSSQCLNNLFEETQWLIMEALNADVNEKLHSSILMSDSNNKSVVYVPKKFTSTEALGYSALFKDEHLIIRKMTDILTKVGQAVGNDDTIVQFI